MLGNRLIKIAIVLTFSTLAFACQKEAKYTTIDGFAEGTTFHIVYKEKYNKNLRPEIEKILADFDNDLSIYNPNSMVCKVNSSDRIDTIELSEWFIKCFEMSQTVSSQTNGMFDVTLKPLIAAYGFGAQPKDSTGQRTILSQVEIDSIMNMVGYQNIAIDPSTRRLVRKKPGIQLDFNAIAKGYSVDVVAGMFDEMGINDYMVEIGGEIFCRGLNPKGAPWRVGVDKPFEGNNSPGQQLQTVLTISELGLATSGNYRKFKIEDNGTRTTHTINPKTGRSVNHNLLSATIIASTSAIADGYATACMVMGLEQSIEFLKKHPELNGYLIYVDLYGGYQVYMTPSIEKLIHRPSVQ